MEIHEGLTLQVPDLRDAVMDDLFFCVSLPERGPSRIGPSKNRVLHVYIHTEIRIELLSR